MKICLICCAGMSTSAIVKRMQDAAANEYIDAEIWAVGETLAKENLEKADVVLLGPQIRYALAKIQALDPSKPVGLIDMRDYGMLNGKKILDDAIALLNK